MTGGVLTDPLICCLLSNRINSNASSLELSFPMSGAVKSLMPSGLSYAAKEVACHATEKFIDKLTHNGIVDNIRSS